MELKIKSISGYVRAISGVFITKENPTGLTPKELAVLSGFVFFCAEKNTDLISTEIKKEVGLAMSMRPQVVTNYMKKFRDKKILTKDNKLHSIFRSRAIKIINPIITG